MRFGLRDAAGMVHPLEIDTNCRNHLFMAHELALLPYLRSFYGTGFRSLRLEIPGYSAAEAGAVTALYRANIDRLWRDPEVYEFATDDWEQLLQARKATFGAGPYLRGVQVQRMNSRKEASTAMEDFMGPEQILARKESLSYPA